MTVRTAFQRAADYISELFEDNVTVYIDAEIESLSGSVIGSTNFVPMPVTYSSVRTQLTGDNNSGDESIVDQLSSSTPTYTSNAGVASNGT